MPRFDRTGPWGFGPRTGRGLGPCGYGGRRFASAKNERIVLEDEIKALEEEIAMLREEIKALEDQKK